MSSVRTRPTAATGVVAREVATAVSGLEFLTALRTEPYGRVAVFRDIAGNKWDLIGPG